MRCIYCDDILIKSNFSDCDRPVTVSGEGVAHSKCFENHLLHNRVFMGISLGELSNVHFTEMFRLMIEEYFDRKVEDGFLDADLENTLKYLYSGETIETE